MDLQAMVVVADRVVADSRMAAVVVAEVEVDKDYKYKGPEVEEVVAAVVAVVAVVRMLYPASRQKQ